MKKFFLVAAGLLLSLAAALPLAVGLGLEQAVNRLLSELTRVDALALAASRYERGYASSQLDLEFKPLLNGAPQPLSLRVRFKHGPLLAGTQLQLGLLGLNAELTATSTAQLNVAKDEALYQLEGLINVWGAGSFTDCYNPLSLALQQGRGQWGRGEGRGRVNWQAQRVDYEGHLSQLSWQSPELSVNLADIDIAKQASLTADGAQWFSRLAFKALNAQLQNQQYWLQRGALGISRAGSASLATPERWQMSLVAEDFKAKHLQLTSLDANFALDQVPAAWLLPFAGLLFSAAPPEVFAAQAHALTQQHLKAPAGLLVERFGAVQEGKTFWLSGRVELATLAALPLEAWGAPEAVLGQLAGSGEVHLDKSLLPLWAKAYLDNSSNGQTLSPAQIEVLAKAFVAQGMLTEAGEHYRTQVAFKAGEITLNDKPVVLPF